MNRTKTRLRIATLALLAAIVAVSAAHAGDPNGRDPQAITLWWVIFNNPEECEAGCDGDDLANPAVAPSVVYASGAFVRSGRATRLVASLYEQAAGFADEVIGGPGLLDAEGAEIHLVVRSHGPRIQKLRFEQILRFADAGCQELGGPNVCRDIQFAVHPPGRNRAPLFWWPDLGGGTVDGANSRLWRDADGVRLMLRTSIK